jgi:hypothetical protein
VVTSSRAPDLSIQVLAESRKKTKKVFVNQFVERLTVSVPCNFNLHLVMEKVQEVILVHPEPAHCIYFKSPASDRHLHRSGLCCVSLASVFKRCPSISSFAEVTIAHVSMDQTFTKWNNKIKKLFFEDYRRRGGDQELKAWGRARGGGRWFNKQEVIPQKVGHDREEF